MEQSFEIMFLEQANAIMAGLSEGPMSAKITQRRLSQGSEHAKELSRRLPSSKGELG